MSLPSTMLMLGIAAVSALQLAGRENGFSRAQQALLMGVEQVKLGHLARAQSEFRKAIALNANNSQANFQLGLLLGQAGNIPAARDCFRRALATKADWPEAHFNLGLTLISEANAKRDWPAALSEFRAAVRLNPKYTEAYHLLGTGLQETGARQAAMTVLQQGLQNDPGSPTLHLDFARALEENGDAGRAEQELREALRLRTGYQEAEIALGKLLSTNANSQGEATELLRQAVQTNPDSAAAQYALAKALQRAGHPAEAAVAFREAGALSKRQEDMVLATNLSNQGLDAAHKGDIAQALLKLREAVDLCPNAAIPHYNLGLVLASKGEYQGARTQVIAAVSLAPLEMRFYKTLAELWKITGDEARAQAAASRSKGLIEGTASNDSLFEYGAGADTADGHFAFAAYLAKSSEWQIAAGEWLRVLALRPKDLNARNNLAITFAHLGKDDAAELEFRKILQINNDSAAAHFGLAMLNLQHDKREAASTELQEVLRIDPSYAHAKSLFEKVSSAIGK